jgi:protein-S-isoprenylcysteine O-methyltransferase Ste14
MPATTVLSICGVVVFLTYEVVLRRRNAETATWRSEDGDRGSTQLILGAYMVVIAVNVALGGASTARVSPTWRWVGVVCLAAGLVVRAWAMTTLGRHYTRTLRTVDEQQVVDRGPYRVVRHPGYSGSILVWVGYAIGLGNWIATATTAVLLGAVYVWRINAEEALLRRSFGDSYADYQRHTKRLLPFVY